MNHDSILMHCKVLMLAYKHYDKLRFAMRAAFHITCIGDIAYSLLTFTIYLTYIKYISLFHYNHNNARPNMDTRIYVPAGMHLCESDVSRLGFLRL